MPEHPPIGGSPTVVTGRMVVAGGKTATINNTVTFNGTDGTAFTLPATSGTIALIDAANTFSGTQTFSGLINANLGLTVAGAAFNSRGIADSATATALTLSGSGANSVTIANSATNPTIGTSAGNLALAPAGLLAVSVEAPASTVNYLSISGAATGGACVIRPNSAVDTNIGLTLDSKGSGQITFRTDPYGTPATQAAVLHTASADRYITLTGANGANPKISTSAGSLDIGAAVVFTGQTVGTTVGAAGGASALPATPLGYLTTAINGTACKIPYYTA